MTLSTLKPRPTDDERDLMLAAIRILLPIAKGDYHKMLGAKRYPSMLHPERERVDKLAEGIALAEAAMRDLEPHIETGGPTCTM
jgi:hypothetical protein